MSSDPFSNDLGLEEENLQVTAPIQASSAEEAEEADINMSNTSNTSTILVSDDDLGLEEDHIVRSKTPVPPTYVFSDDLGLEEDDPIQSVSPSQASTAGASKNRFSREEKGCLFGDSNHDIDEYGLLQEQTVTKVVTETAKQSTSATYAATSNSSTVRHLSDAGNTLSVLEQRLNDSLVFYYYYY